MKNNKLLIVLLSVLLVSLSGCGEYKDETTNTIPTGTNSEVKEVTLKDGTRCVIYESYRRGGIVCEWKKAN